MYIFIILTLCLNLVDSQGLNLIKCDPHATTLKGCFLREHDLEWITRECGDGFVLSSTGKCVPPCETGKYLFGDSCLPCTANCGECFGPEEFQCSRCSSLYTLNSHGLCSLRCDATVGSYGLPQDGANPNQCLQCDESCSSCFYGSGASCTSCPSLDSTGSAFFLKPLWYSLGRTNAGYCIKVPPVNGFFREYPNDKVIVQCPAGCSKCLDRFKCTGCQTGYSLYPPESYGTEYSLCYADPVEVSS
jgi:hypothetical protein